MQMNIWNIIFFKNTTDANSKIRVFDFINIDKFNSTVEHATSCIEITATSTKQEVFGFCPENKTDIEPLFKSFKSFEYCRTHDGMFPPTIDLKNLIKSVHNSKNKPMGDFSRRKRKRR